MKAWNGKVSKLNIVIYMLFIALFKPYFLPTKVQQLMKMAFLIIVFMYLLVNSTRKVLFNYSIVLCVSVLLSSSLGVAYGYCDTIKGYLDAIQYALCIYCLFTLALYSASKGRLTDFVKCFLKISVIYAILIILFSNHPLGIDEADTNLKIYILGNKFSSCYYFILLTGLFCCLRYKKICEMKRYKMYLLMLTALSLGVSVYFDTMTLAMASVVPIVIVLLPHKTREVLLNKAGVLVACVISAILPFLFSGILKFEFIQVLIRDVMHKRLDLTGRMEIYTVHLIPVLKERLFIGRGYHNTAIKDVCIYTNAQNGLLQYMINFGFLGVLLLIWLLLKSVKMAKKDSVTVGALLVIYAMLVAAVLEISINWYFFAAFAIIYANKDMVNRKDNNLRRSSNEE